MLPTADTGIIDSSGVFFPEAILPLVWRADNKLAHLRLQGVGYVTIPLENGSKILTSCIRRIGLSSLSYM